MNNTGNVYGICYTIKNWREKGKKTHGAMTSTVSSEE